MRLAEVHFDKVKAAMEAAAYCVDYLTEDTLAQLPPHVAGELQLLHDRITSLRDYEVDLVDIRLHVAPAPAQEDLDVSVTLDEALEMMDPELREELLAEEALAAQETDV